MDNAQILSWIVGAIGIFGFFLAGRKVWWCWYVNVACQFLWAWYAIASGTPAFLVTAGFYTAVFGWNAYKWTKERNAYAGFRKATKENVSGTYVLPSGVKVTYSTVVEDGNLVKHARTELERIGEDADVIEWYIRVIKEYSSFGHSGGSHMAIMPCLTRLLNFQPLSPLTNDPEEWMHHTEEVWGKPGGVWQNRRDGRMFSNDGGRTFTCVDDPEKEDGSSEVYCSKVVVETYEQV